MRPNQINYLFTYFDAYLGPIYFLVFLFLITRWKKKYYKNSPISKYIVPGFIAKMIGCVLLAMLFHFYYGQGDIHNYYTGEVEIWNAFSYNPKYGLELIFQHLDNCSPKAQEFAYHMAYKEFSEQTAYMFRIAGFIGLFCFGSYLPTAMVFTTLSFLGSWRIFKCFYEEFPKYHKYIAIGCLFVPSSVVWGGNILKDPLCIFGMGLMVTSMYDIIKKRFTLYSLAEMAVGAFILLVLKAYIFYVLIATLLITLYHVFIVNGSRKKLRIGFKTVLYLSLAVFLYWYSENSVQIGDLIFEKFTQKAEIIQGAISSLSQGDNGSAYEIPNVTDYSPWGILRSYLISLSTTLFRPFLWESNNLIAFLNAIESFMVLILTLFVMIKHGFIKFFTFAGTKPILMFGLVFTLLFAPLVGFISFNFGTLIRYKLPMVPFYYTYILVLWASIKHKQAVSNG
ncbi:MAG: hypothetical protein ACOYKE_08850 [Ferruginibacter sp.]